MEPVLSDDSPILLRLQARFPGITWTAPIQITLPNRSGWVCRICIAEFGIRADDDERVFATAVEASEHIRAYHQPSEPTA